MKTMYIVYVQNQFTLLGKEYFGTDGKTIIGFHDPGRASHFESIEDAKEFCKLFDYEDRKIEPITKHIKSFEKCNFVYRKISMLDKSTDIKYDNKKHDALAVLEWRIKHAKASEKSVSFENYRTWPDLYSVFKYLHSLNAYHSIDYKSKFYSVQLKTPKNGNYLEFYEELKLVLDYCTFIDKEGRKIFEIFDHELCEYEKRSLVFGGDENCAINNGRCDMFEGTLEECFNLMKREYWYE